MPLPNLTSLHSADLLRLHARISHALNDRGILRSANNPTGDLAEYIFCKAFGWTQEANSQHGYDARDEAGVRYQIKGLRLHRTRKTRQLSAIRKLDEKPFDVLAGVIFGDEYEVVRAALIPQELVEPNARYATHTNAHLFHLRDSVWDLPGVKDVTARLQAVEL